MKQKELKKNRLLPKDLKEWERMRRIVQALNEGKLIMVRYADGSRKLVNNNNYRW